MALLNLSSSMGQYVGGQIQADWSYPELFLGAGIFQIAVVGLLFFIDPDQTRRVLGAADDAQRATPRAGRGRAPAAAAERGARSARGRRARRARGRRRGGPRAARAAPR
jgi:hypothetical protein